VTSAKVVRARRIRNKMEIVHNVMVLWRLTKVFCRAALRERRNLGEKKKFHSGMQKSPKGTSRRWEVISEYIGTGRSVAVETFRRARTSQSKERNSFICNWMKGKRTPKKTPSEKNAPRLAS
jgi:hypothetical protein